MNRMKIYEAVKGPWGPFLSTNKNNEKGPHKQCDISIRFQEMMHQQMMTFSGITLSPSLENVISFSLISWKLMKIVVCPEGPFWNIRRATKKVFLNNPLPPLDPQKSTTNWKHYRVHYYRFQNWQQNANSFSLITWKLMKIVVCSKDLFCRQFDDIQKGSYKQSATSIRFQEITKKLMTFPYTVLLPISNLT